MRGAKNGAIHEVAKSVDDAQKLGLLGDYIGGVWGTLFSFLTLGVVFLTWRQTKRTDRRNRTIAIVAEMLKTHDQIVAGTPDLSAKILREFGRLYRATVKQEPDYEIWSIDDRINIAYTYVFYGLNSESMHALDGLGSTKIKAVHDYISRLKEKGGDKFSNWFKGYQSSLSHYMRNLFSMYVFIENEKISDADKYNIGKIIRSKLSNYDQAVLSLNFISHLGRDWENMGLVERYKTFANVPKHFLVMSVTYLSKNAFQ